MMIKLDPDTAIQEVYEHLAEDAECQEYEKEFMDLLEQVKGYNRDLYFSIEAAESISKTKALELSYSKGFHDGLKFLLGVISGKEVIRFHDPKVKTIDKKDKAIVGIEKGLREALYSLVNLEEELNS